MCVQMFTVNQNKGAAQSAQAPPYAALAHCCRPCVHRGILAPAPWSGEVLGYLFTARRRQCLPKRPCTPPRLYSSAAWRHRHSSSPSARARARPGTERAATHRTLLVPVGRGTLRMQCFPLEIRRAPAVMGDKGIDEHSQTTSAEERDRSAACEAAKGSGNAHDAQHQHQRSRLQ